MTDLLQDTKNDPGRWFGLAGALIGISSLVSYSLGGASWFGIVSVPLLASFGFGVSYFGYKRAKAKGVISHDAVVGMYVNGFLLSLAAFFTIVATLYSL